MVVSLESPQEARQTQDQFPHLRVVSDQDRELASRADVIDLSPAPAGGAMAMPAKVLIDREGIVRRIFRPQRYIVRVVHSGRLQGTRVEPLYLPGRCLARQGLPELMRRVDKFLATPK